uniref:Putative secreted protein n=1 Tax=Anopheles marajoara TaxID=58244 RepID=A0A2M4CBK2_9DIPT
MRGRAMFAFVRSFAFEFSLSWSARFTNTPDRRKHLRVARKSSTLCTNATTRHRSSPSSPRAFGRNISWGAWGTHSGHSDGTFN